MVLVANKPSNDIGILQTKLNDREGHETRRVGLETIPLDQHIEGRHGERQACLKIHPASMHHLFEMADDGQHGEYRLHQPAVLPLATLAQFQIARIALGSMEAGITQDNHALFKLPNQPLERVIRDIGRGTGPPHNQPPLIEQQTEFPPDDPAMVRHAFKQLLRSSRRKVSPVELIDGPFLMRHEHLAGALVELRQIGKASSSADGVLHHPPEAFDGIEMVAPMGRQAMEAKLILIVVEGRVKLMRPMNATAVDYHDDLFASFPKEK